MIRVSLHGFATLLALLARSRERVETVADVVFTFNADGAVGAGTAHAARGAPGSTQKGTANGRE